MGKQPKPGFTWIERKPPLTEDEKYDLAKSEAQRLKRMEGYLADCAERLESPLQERDDQRIENLAGGLTKLRTFAIALLWQRIALNTACRAIKIKDQEFIPPRGTDKELTQKEKKGLGKEVYLSQSVAGLITGCPELSSSDEQVIRQQGHFIAQKTLKPPPIQNRLAGNELFLEALGIGHKGAHEEMFHIEVESPDSELFHAYHQCASVLLKQAKRVLWWNARDFRHVFCNEIDKGRKDYRNEKGEKKKNELKALANYIPLPDKVLSRRRVPPGLLFDLEEGVHIVPVLGQDVSRRAGVITPEHHPDYLRYVLYRCLASEKERDGDEKLWDLAKHGFPPVPLRRERIQQCNDWFEKIGDVPASDPTNRIADEVLTTDGNWLEMLHLLCRIKRGTPDRLVGSSMGSPISSQVKLGRWSRSVVDAYAIFSARECRPAQTHRMLAYLARPLRIHAAITTNPDSLLEDAFREAGRPLRSFDVEVDPDLPGLLPDYRQVRAQDSVVKVNIRAIRDPKMQQGSPRLADKLNFYRYIFPRFPEFSRPSQGEPDHYTPGGRLLVVGLLPRFSLLPGLMEHVVKEAIAAASHPEIKSALDWVRQRRLGHTDYSRADRRYLGELGEALTKMAECLKASKYKAYRNQLKQLQEILNPPDADSNQSPEEWLNRAEESIDRWTKDFWQNFRGEMANQGHGTGERGSHALRLKLLLEESADAFKSHIKPALEARAMHALAATLRKNRLSAQWAVANFRIYWVCDGEMEERIIRDRFEPIFDASSASSALSFDDVFCLVHTRRPDIFLYELYQETCLCLPPGGLGYQFVNYVPPDPMQPVSKHQGDVDAAVDDLRESLKAADPKTVPSLRKKSAGYRLIPLPASKERGKLIAAYGGRGFSNAAATAFEKLQGQRIDANECVWLELADFANPEELRTQIFTSIAYRKGVLRREHISLALGRDAPETALNQIAQKLEIQRERWVVFLYGRSLPGANAGWRSNEFWGKEEFKRLFPILKSLQKIGLNIVYFPPPASRVAAMGEYFALPKKESTKPTTDTEVAAAVLKKPRKSAASANLDPSEPNGGWSPLHHMGLSQIFAKVVEWLNEGTDPDEPVKRGGNLAPDRKRDRLRFLYALSQFRHSRHFSALSSEATYPCPRRFAESIGFDNDESRAARVRGWIEDLCKIGLIRYKHGWFVWIHWEFRVYIQHCLEKGLEPSGEPIGALKESLPEVFFKDDGDDEGRKVLAWKSRIHHWIAEWYFKAFLASRHPLPLRECLYHHLSALRASPHAELPTDARRRIGELAHEDDDARKQYEEKAQLGYQQQLARSAVLEIIKTLRIARPSIRFWFNQETADFIIGSTEAEVDSNVKPLAKTLDTIYKELNEEGFFEAVKLQIPWEQLNEELNSVALLLYTEAGTHLGFDLGAKEDVVIPSANPAIDKPAQETPEQMQHAAHRRYSTAVENVCSILNDEGLEENDVATLCHARDPGNCHFTLGKWLMGFTGNGESPTPILSPKQMNQVFQTVSFLLQLQVKRCKLFEAYLESRSKGSDGAEDFWPKEMHEEFDLESNAPRFQLIDRNWAQVCALASSVARLSGLLDPDNLDLQLRENVTSRALYGLALAHLRRFAEAHRRLDEAGAYLANSRAATYHAEWGVLALRRAEVYLLQSIDHYVTLPFTRGVESTIRKRLVHLDDAWADLERAGRFFGGETRSNWWWGRFHVIKLKVLAELEILRRDAHEVTGEPTIKGRIGPLARRARIHRFKQIRSTIVDGLALYPSDPYRNGKLLDTLLHMWQENGRASGCEGEIRKDLKNWYELNEATKVSKFVADALSLKEWSTLNPQDVDQDLAREFVKLTKQQFEKWLTETTPD